MHRACCFTFQDVSLSRDGHIGQQLVARKTVHCRTPAESESYGARCDQRGVSRVSTSIVVSLCLSGRLGNKSLPNLVKTACRSPGSTKHTQHTCVNAIDAACVLIRTLVLQRDAPVSADESQVNFIAGLSIFKLQVIAY